ncbi:sensor histidine kinase [Micromonospora sp. NPDC002389]|uniref:sensor histidine kinase n=1 Tax=Micromonospora sp. NPDC002389 TaxID=3154272 RepID=UPI00332621C8
MTPPTDTWSARFRLWDGYFALATVGVAVAVAADGSRTPAARLGCLALFLALTGWYLGVGRRLMRDSVEDWRSYLYLAGVVLLYVPAVLLSGTASFLLFVLNPQMFMVLPAVPAVGAVLLLNSVHVIVLAVRLPDLGDVLPPLLIALMTVLVVSVLGVWAQHTVAESGRRAELIAQLEQTRAELAEVSHRAGVAAERQRLAADIHDTVAQGLSSVVMLVQAADADLDRDPDQARRHLDLARQTARENLLDVRTLVAALTPTQIDGSPLEQALHRLTDRFTRETGVPVTCTADLTTGRTPGTAVEVVLLRAAQEALTNVRRHADATAVAVLLHGDDDRVTLEIGDDGAGFDPADAYPADDGGYGLTGLRTRVEQVDGTVVVRSAPGEGTTIRVEVPYQ